MPVASHVAWRRPPVINIGTYLRCAAVDQVIHAFVLGQPELPGLGPDRPITLRPFVPTAEPPVAKGENPVQIISLGAGSDSRLWKLKVRPPDHYSVLLGMVWGTKADDGIFLVAG